MKLVDPSKIIENEFDDFIGEFKAAREALVPFSLKRKGKSFNAYVRSLGDESLGIGLPENWVPASTCFLVDDEGRIYGAVNIRHWLTENLRIEGGHIGYGIRPSKRNKGYGTRILSLALEETAGMGISRVLVTCDKENVHSASVILRNGGELDSEIEYGNKILQRYWIET